jgi:hypothetical protein
MTRRKAELAQHPEPRRGEIDVLEALRSLRRRAADGDERTSKILTAAIREIEDLQSSSEDLMEHNDNGTH